MEQKIRQGQVQGDEPWGVLTDPMKQARKGWAEGQTGVWGVGTP